jgi:Kef-type K+ transport system membrane component KefB
MEQSIFYQLSLVLAVAAIVALAVRLLRQPPVIGYIATGFIVGPSLLHLIHNEEAFESFSQIGISLLLFMVGLGLNVAVIRRTGKPVLLTFLFITLGLGGLGYGISHILGFTVAESLVLATALLFSSTIIVVKALSDKKDQGRLYGQIAIGILLVEDIIATFALLFVSASGNGSAHASDFILLVLKGAGLAAALTFVGAFILPRLTRFIANSQELLFLATLAWAFGVASAFWWAGFSLEVGALFAGVAFAHLPYAQGISTRLKPLRDFFIVLFFIGLGVELGLNNIAVAIVPALIFSALIMVMKPLLTMIGLGLLGYTRQTNFKAAVHLSQISEFSVVLVVLAYNTGLVSEKLITVTTLTALITIALSTYLIQYDEKIYRRLSGVLSIFERAETRREVKSLEHYPLVLLGYHKGGHEFIRTFRHMKKPYVVIDFDPDVIEELERQGINHLYGDVTDPELLDEIGVHRSEIVISTIGDAATNELILSHIMHRNREALFICHASGYDEAEALYEKGAAYVIVPHFIGSEQISAFIRRNGSNKHAFNEYRKKHLVTIGQEPGKA